MSNYEINDKREIKDFKGISFSQYKKSDVIKQLKKNIILGKIENSNYWCAELICASHFIDIWECFFFILGKHIHMGNPKLPIYVNTRLNEFKDIINTKYLNDELKMRNDYVIRKLFCEIVTILCFSQKKHTYDIIKISDEEFNIIEIQYKLKADSLTFVNQIFKKNDPKELFIACNELSYSLHKNNMFTNDACYWFEWINEFEKKCKKKKEVCICERRTFPPILEKYQTDIIWLIWDIILSESLHRNNLVQKIIINLMNLFSVKYKPNIKTKRRFLIYFAFSILCESNNLNIKIINNPISIQDITSKINNIYKKIKQNEIEPTTNYLFSGIRDNNNDKTKKLLDTMNSISFIPRS